MTDRVPAHRDGRASPALADMPAGWYPDPDDRSSPPKWERYWDGTAWGGSYRRHRAWSARDDAEPTPTRGAANAAVALSLGSMVVPAVVWLAMPDRVSGSTVSSLAFLSLLSCIAALTGFICGIVGRHEARGAAAILLSILGGLFSAGTFLAMGLALAFGGMNAGL